MTEGGEVLILISGVIFIVVCIWFLSSTVNEVKSRGEELGVFDLDSIPLPPSNGLTYLVSGFSQAGSSHGTSKEFCDFNKAIKHLQARLNKSSMFSVRVYHNKNSHFFEYHRSFYDGKGTREGRKLGGLTIYYSEPDFKLKSYNDAIDDGVSIVEANKIYDSGISYKKEVKVEVDIIKSKMESDIVLEFVGESKNKATIAKLADQQIYIAELIVDNDVINVAINGEKVARVSATTKTKSLQFIETIGVYIKVLVWNTESMPSSIHMLCHRDEHTVEANIKKNI